jgi:hypothetical protein
LYFQCSFVSELSTSSWEHAVPYDPTLWCLYSTLWFLWLSEDGSLSPDHLEQSMKQQVCLNTIQSLATGWIAQGSEVEPQ